MTLEAPRQGLRSEGMQKAAGKVRREQGRMRPWVWRERARVGVRWSRRTQWDQSWCFPADWGRPVAGEGWQGSTLRKWSPEGWRGCFKAQPLTWTPDPYAHPLPLFCEFSLKRSWRKKKKRLPSKRLSSCRSLEPTSQTMHRAHSIKRYLEEAKS